MDLQNKNGVAEKNGSTKENIKTSSNGEAKPSTSNVAPKDNAAKTELQKGNPATEHFTPEPTISNEAKEHPKEPAEQPKAEIVELPNRH